MRVLGYAGLAAAAALAVGCDGIKQAMSPHADVVARVKSQELGVERLGQLLGGAPPSIPMQAEVTAFLANVWVDYESLGIAAADNDSLLDKKAIDAAMWMDIDQLRLKKLHDIVAKDFKLPDTLTLTEADYLANDWLAASHILLQFPPTPTDKQVDSVRRAVEAIRVQVTPANFAKLAEKYTQDPSSKSRGGDLGMFPKAPGRPGMPPMVEEFEKAVLALKPGQISPLVRTQYGYHIIMRTPYATVKSEFGQRVLGEAIQTADSTFISKLEAEGNVQVKATAPATVKAVAVEFEKHRNDNTVLGTSKGGKLTVAKLVQWIRSYPQPQQLVQQITSSPDSDLASFVKRLVGKDLVIHEADRLKIVAAPAELDSLHKMFGDMVVQTWKQLNIEPSALMDSGKTVAERQKIAAARIDMYLTALLSQQAPFVQIPDPLEAVLRKKYGGKVIDAGVTRALERGTAVRQAADSVRAATRPPTDVPMPGAPGRGSPPPDARGGPPPARRGG